MKQSWRQSFLPILRPLKRGSQRYLGLPIAKVQSRFSKADISIFHQFQPPPAGGGHQFLRTLSLEFVKQGFQVENNLLSPTTQACLFNSHNFDLERLQGLRREGCYMVHRVDGPIDVYRGWDGQTDKRIWHLNQTLAEVTIFQSEYSLHKHLELGLIFQSPQIIMNVADPSIFHPQGRLPFDHQRKIRLISSSWSANPRKGGPVYKWLEDHLDWNRFEYTFVGQASETFTQLRHIPPLPSQKLADQLRQHDIYITASQDDPCSNALIEALTCGLPAIYLRSGGHPEIVQSAGFGFSDKEEIPVLLGQLIDEYEQRQARIALPSLSEVAERYLEVMQMKE